MRNTQRKGKVTIYKVTHYGPDKALTGTTYRVCWKDKEGWGRTQSFKTMVAAIAFADTLSAP